MKIRGYRPADAVWLTAVHNQLAPHDRRTPQSWGYLSHGRAWMLLRDRDLVGYSAVLPVPGLPQLGELEGFIAPAWRRQGFAAKLLHYIQAELRGSSIHQLSHPVPHLHTPAASFLLKNNFFVEHEEWMMTLTPIHPNPPPVYHSQLSLQSFSPQQTISIFRQLYKASFTGTRWDQPFTTAEIADLLTENNPIYFLLEANRPVGFVWVRQHSSTAVALEPVGIVKEKQGRGYGRFLLHTILNQLAAAGIETVHIGVWANNETAVHLYKSFGFQKTGGLYYLAYDLQE